MVIFTIPKAFTEPHIAMIQRQAIWSWTQLNPMVAIMLFGDDEGVRDVALEFRCGHYRDVETVEGIPVMSDVFNQMQEAYPNEMLLYINADIIVFDDLPNAIDAAADEFDEFLLVGDRYNWSNPHFVEPNTGWQDEIRADAKEHGWMDPPVCKDYFAFPSGMITEMPPFLVGRYANDTWIVSHCYIERDIPTIDASQAVFVIHQDHSKHRNSRVDPLSLRNIAMIERDDMRTGGRSDLVPYEMTAGGEIVRREQ